MSGTICFVTGWTRFGRRSRPQPSGEIGAVVAHGGRDARGGGGGGAGDDSRSVGCGSECRIRRSRGVRVARGGGHGSGRGGVRADQGECGRGLNILNGLYKDKGEGGGASDRKVFDICFQDFFFFFFAYGTNVFLLEMLNQ